MKNVLTAILSYFKNTNKDVIKYVNLTDNKGWTPLFSTINNSENGLPEIVEILVKNGANINHKDKYKLTPLHLACYKGQDDNVEYLIKTGTNLDAVDSLGSKMILIFLIVTPIFYSITEGQTNALQALLDSGANIKHRDNKNKSLL